MPFLTTKPFDFGDRHAGDTDFRQRFTHVIHNRTEFYKLLSRHELDANDFKE
jgi:hypothetical protein